MNQTRKALFFATIGTLMLIGLITSQINFEHLTAPDDITFRDGAARVFVLACGYVHHGNTVIEHREPESHVRGWLRMHDFTFQAFERFDFESPCTVERQLGGRVPAGLNTVHGKTLSGWLVYRKP